MSEYATKGAMLVCTGGSAPSKLQVTSNTSSFIQGNAVATTSDKIPNTNIMPFGVCKLKPFSPPCVPAPIMWTGFVASVEIPGGNPLLKTSTIQCACGGMIQFQNSGQMKPNKVVVNPSSPQIDALRKAALEAVPFCEECEKRKEEKEGKITRIFWVDECGEQKTLSELPPNYEITLCVETAGYKEGETIEIEITDNDGRLYKGEKDILKFSAKTEYDNTAYIDNVKLEYEE